MVYHGIFFIPTSIWFSNLGAKLQNKALRIINFKPLRYSVNSLYNKCEILKFGDRSYQIFYMHMIILRVICQQPCVLVLHFWTVNTHRLLEIKKVTR